MRRGMIPFMMAGLILLCQCGTAEPASGTADRAADIERHQFSSRHMGTTFRIVLYAPDADRAAVAADSAFQRVEELNHIFSDYETNSEVNQLSALAGSGEMMRVSEPLYDVLKRAKRVSEQTDGAFDITAGALVRLWREIRRADEPQLPGRQTLNQALESVDYRYLILDEHQPLAGIKKPGVILDLGGIAKGYAAEEMLSILQDYGFTSALIDAGGDMVMGEPPPGREGWGVLVSVYASSGDAEPFLLLLDQSALSTSGDLYQYVEIDGVRYSHIINPATGMALTEQRMVTVTGVDGTLVDAYSTALSVMPVDEAMAFIEDKPDYSAFIQVREGDRVSIYESECFGRIPRQALE